jgi:hypothetical protein
VESPQRYHEELLASSIRSVSDVSSLRRTVLRTCSDYRPMQNPLSLSFLFFILDSSAVQSYGLTTHHASEEKEPEAPLPAEEATFLVAPDECQTALGNQIAEARVDMPN